MKNLTLFLILALFTCAVQSQTLTENEITGTWQVVDVVEVGTKPKQAKEMVASYIDILPDHSFQIRMRNIASKKFENKFDGYKWNYNTSSQTIELSKGDMSIKPSKSNGKMYFEIPETGMKLEVVMPI
ncbi:hypothetical protein EI546_13330 [Aequorivita sp. H23M31]|uniref:Lipocalin-like domain-containing protein n=1 Tax=Aequorivita ciconiae TaxID=2494375 RepID=A0A410G5U9_9FLAO|nr:hypothetical protein [Aequorivita sp. H23M31]QAA82639.1 hypothetical protein EI546_13330 [Aequorivita sp. H23M31]